MLYPAHILAALLLSLGAASGMRLSPALGSPRCSVTMQALSENSVGSVVDFGERDTKKNLRRKIMSAKDYKRGGAPFDQNIHKEVTQKMSEKFAGQLVEEMKKSPFRELVTGEGKSKTTFVLAKEFGFCWGVERSIELAWAAREAYPDKTMHITNELIHNPGVNEMLHVRSE